MSLHVDVSENFQARAMILPLPTPLQTVLSAIGCIGISVIAKTRRRTLREIPDRILGKLRRRDFMVSTRLWPVAYDRG